MGVANKIKELVFAPLKRSFADQNSEVIDYDLKEAVEFMQITILLRNMGTDGRAVPDEYLEWNEQGGWFCLTDPIFDSFNIDSYYQEKLLGPLKKDLARETLPERKEQIKEQITLVEKIKKDHLRMARKWTEIWKFATHRQALETSKDIAKLKDIYNSLMILEEEYQEYNCGRNLAELKKIGEELEKRLALNNSIKKNLEEISLQAQKETVPRATEEKKKTTISTERKTR